MGEGVRGLELLTPAEMAEADRRAIEAGPHDGYALMRNAGAAVAAEMLRRYPDAARFDVLCGPGNNGGDGYVVARLLHAAGVRVDIYAEDGPREGSDAALAAADCPLAARSLESFSPREDGVVVDALYGAGLARPLDGAAARAARACHAAGARVVAVDLPSGLSGETGRAAGVHFSAALTVTFARRKPGHLLLPGRALCGEVVVADIGIGESAIAAAAPRCFVNAPGLWRHHLSPPPADAHKYSRGHVAVFSGGPSSTGAARLSAMAAARAGAGAVTVASPGSALAVNAAHLTAIMLARVDEAGDLNAFLGKRRVASAVIGPGFGDGDRLRAFALSLLGEADAPGSGVVLDADVFTAFAAEPGPLLAATTKAGRSGRVAVLTPHEGEFGRLFPDIAANVAASKVDKARAAAERAGAVVVYKGPDTVIAAPDGRAAINENGTPWLATAGSGDVLAGMTAGLLAQKMPAFEAACAAVWLHAEAGRRFGPGLIADDLPDLLPAVLRELVGAPPDLSCRICATSSDPA